MNSEKKCPQWRMSPNWYIQRTGFGVAVVVSLEKTVTKRTMFAKRIIRENLTNQCNVEVKREKSGTIRDRWGVAKHLEISVDQLHHRGSKSTWSFHYKGKPNLKNVNNSKIISKPQINECAAIYLDSDRVIASHTRRITNLQNQIPPTNFSLITFPC